LAFECRKDSRWTAGKSSINRLKIDHRRIDEPADKSEFPGSVPRPPQAQASKEGRRRILRPILCPSQAPDCELLTILGRIHGLRHYASASSLSESCVVKIRTGMFRPSFRIPEEASSPPMPGIVIFRTTRSGFSSRANWIASFPSLPLHKGSIRGGTLPAAA
jgi:hypothetical protein